MIFISQLKRTKRILVRIFTLIRDLNITKTLYVNFKMLSFRDALSFPIFVYGRASLKLKGKIVIKGALKTGMVKFGNKYEMNKREIGVGEFVLLGTAIFNGEVAFGIDTFFYVDKGGFIEIGDKVYVGCRSRVIATKNVIIGNEVQIGYETVITDSMFHFVKDIKSGIIKDKRGEIIIGNRNWVGGRCTIYRNTVTPDECIIASNSICNKDYTSFVLPYSIIGGTPAVLLKSDVARVFDFEKENELATFFANPENSYWNDSV